MKTSLKLITAVMILAFFLMPANVLFAYDFHINPLADSLADDQAEGYIGSSIGSVTNALGSPSMVRNNLASGDMIDYIYIGNGQVYTFEVMRAEGKTVSAYHKYSRGSWEDSVFPAYPPKGT